MKEDQGRPDPAIFDAPGYWNQRLEEQFDLRGVGYRRYNRRYNEYLYRRKSRVLTRIVDCHSIEVAGARVLDLGCGTGHWIRWFLRRGAAEVTGIDVSTASVDRLKKDLPETTVRKGDLTEEWPVEGPFDIISAFDVLYHVIDDDGLERVLVQAAERMVPGGWLLLTDRLHEGTGPDSSPHVRFRSLESYRERLSQLGFDVESVVPLFFLMNGALADHAWVRERPRIRWLMVRMENLLAPLLSRLDRILVGPQHANLRLLVARTPGAGPRGSTPRGPLGAKPVFPPPP